MPPQNHTKSAPWAIAAVFIIGCAGASALPAAGTQKWIALLAVACVIGIPIHYIFRRRGPQAEVADENKERFRNIFEKSSDGIGLIDGQGRVADANPQFLRMFGYEREELIGQSVMMLHPESEYEVIRNILGSLDDKEQIVAEFRCLRKDGSIFSVESSGSRVEIGGQIFVQGILRDVTQRRKMEEDLVEAKEKAEQNDRLKSAFLANMSHEIRTPLNGIMGFAQLLRDDDLSLHERRRFVDIINANGRHLLDLIGDLIDIAQIETNQLKLHPEAFDLVALLQEAYATFSPQIQQRRNRPVALALDINPAQAITVIADETRLRQVLYNLLSNAFKFTSTGEIRFGYSIQDSGKLEFFVSDTGVGIPLEHQASVFTRFVQIDPAMTRNFGGAGLGLAISKGIIELFNGDIQIESAPGSGTTFRFTIESEFHTKTVPLASKPTIEKEPKTRALFHTPPLVLVAEDNDTNFELTRRILQSINIDVIRAVDGPEAIAECSEREDIDLVLMDIRMPKIDGLDATRCIKAKRPNLPIIVQTAHAMQTDRQAALDAGSDGFIVKPISADELIASVRTTIATQAKAN